MFSFINVDFFIFDYILCSKRYKIKNLHFQNMYFNLQSFSEYILTKFFFLATSLQNDNEDTSTTFNYRYKISNYSQNIPLISNHS